MPQGAGPRASASASLLFPLFHFNELLARGDLCFFLPNKEMNTSLKNTGKRKRQSWPWSQRCWMCHWQRPKAAGPRSRGSSRALLGSPSSKPHACRCKALQNLRRVGPKGLVWGVRQQAGDSCPSWRAGTQEGARPPWKHRAEPRLQVQTSLSPSVPTAPVPPLGTAAKGADPTALQPGMPEQPGQALPYLRWGRGKM